MRISLEIQDGKLDAFLKFIKTLDFVTLADDAILSSSQKEELMNRKETAKPEDFISLEEANKILFEKYGL